MKLTGKCKVDFKKWLLCSTVYGEHEYHLDEDLLSHFENLKTSMKYGVYVDFFDSVGIYIIISRDSGWYDVDIAGEWTSTTTQDNRTEARIVAIEKANEIYNKI